jgi:hypothetical protein
MLCSDFCLFWNAPKNAPKNSFVSDCRRFLDVRSASAALGANSVVQVLDFITAAKRFCMRFATYRCVVDLLLPRLAVLMEVLA